MKKVTVIVCCTIIISNILNAQKQTPQLLKQPPNWQFERFVLPPELRHAFHIKAQKSSRKFGSYMSNNFQ